MVRRAFACLAFAAALDAAAAQENIIPAPDDWRKESFAFPLAFAPTIPYQGTEHVRFPPTWQRFASENGFSYVFVWNLKSVPVTTEDLEDYLEAYFNGLMKGVAPARGLQPPSAGASAAIHPMTAIPGWTQSFGAELHTWNAFSKGEPLLLHGEIAHRTCGESRMQIFFAFSRAKRDRPVWEALRAARKATPCEAKGS
jgi:hypothetical protein